MELWWNSQFLLVLSCWNWDVTFNSTTSDISPVGRVLKVRFGVRYPLTTTCLAKWGDTWGEGLGCIGLQTWHALSWRGVIQFGFYFKILIKCCPQTLKINIKINIYSWFLLILLHFILFKWHFKLIFDWVIYIIWHVLYFMFYCQFQILFTTKEFNIIGLSYQILNIHFLNLKIKIFQLLRQ